jgi:hypothetical protein
MKFVDRSVSEYGFLVLLGSSVSGPIGLAFPNPAFRFVSPVLTRVVVSSYTSFSGVVTSYVQTWLTVAHCLYNLVTPTETKIVHAFSVQDEGKRW